MIAPALVVAAIALAAPWVSKVDRARYAEDIAAAAPNLVIARALVATAVTESDFRPAIERCECKGKECDADKFGQVRAFGLYQLHAHHFAGHTAEEVCASNRLSTLLAARVLSGLEKQAGGMEEALRFYIGISVSPKDWRFRRRVELFDLLMEVHGDES